MQKSRFSLLDRIRIPDYDSVRQMQTGDLAFDREKCRECGICVQLCPGGCLLTDSTTKADILSGKARGGGKGTPRVVKTGKGATLCIACFDCGAACPHGAITVKQSFNPGYRFKRLSQTPDLRYPKQY